jgi:hypothetical protein
VEYNDGGNVKLKISVPQNSYIDVRMKNLEIKDEIDTIICKTMIFVAECGYDNDYNDLLLVISA